MKCIAVTFVFLAGCAAGPETESGATITWEAPHPAPVPGPTGKNGELIEATIAGDVARVEQLLADGADIATPEPPKWPFPGGRSPLQIAAQRGDVPMVTLLLAKGADAKGLPNRETALHGAALRGATEIVRLLLDHGAVANQPDAIGTTPMFKAVTSGKTEIVQLLLDHGADVNAKNDEGNTPLMFAVSDCGAEMVRFLLSHGADAKARASDGTTVLGSMNNWGQSAEVLNELYQRGEYDQADLARAFLTLRPLNVLCANEESFLAYTTFFLDHGIDVNQYGDVGDTALMMASVWGYPEAVRALLARGADASLENSEGKSALDCAKNSEIRKLLKQR